MEVERKSITISYNKSALLVFLFAFVLLLVTSPDIGVTWDEPTYMIASEQYVGWFGQVLKDPAYAFSEEGIRHHWEFNHEHPPLNKVWTGFFWAASRGLLDGLSAHRLGNILISAGLIALVYSFIGKEVNPLAGMMAAVGLISMPRFFFHAHLATLDVPVTAFIFVTIVLYWKTRNLTGIAWGIPLGFIFGISLGMKINSLVIIPAVLGLWFLFYERNWNIFSRLCLMAAVGFLLFLISWPWLYYDTFSRLRDYLYFMTVDHYPIAQYYRRNLYTPPPWHFPWITAAAVIPTTIALPGTVAAIRGIKLWRSAPLENLLLLGAVLPLFMFSAGISQVFDNERLFMSVFPFVACLAGIGFSKVVQNIKQYFLETGKHQWRRIYLFVLIAAAISPQLITSFILYPHLLSYYSWTVGSIWGAKKLGLESTYWAQTYRSAVPFLNENAKPNASVWSESPEVLLYYQELGILRDDLSIAKTTPWKMFFFPGRDVTLLPMEEADFVLIAYRQSGFTRSIRRWLKEREPVFQLGPSRIPLLEIYAKDTS
jgi:hypothetical protein